MVNCSGDTYKEHRMQEIRDMEKDAARVERRDARARPLDTTALAVLEQALNPPNPKQRYGDLKPNMALVPGVAVAHEALAMEQGAAKYGAYNWREKAVEALTYISAAKRHMDAWVDGEDYSSDTANTDRPVHNLAHARACLAILLDCIELRNLIDNRPPPGKSSQMQDRIKSLRQQEGKTP